MPYTPSPDDLAKYEAIKHHLHDCLTACERGLRSLDNWKHIRGSAYITNQRQYWKNGISVLRMALVMAEQTYLRPDNG